MMKQCRFCAGHELHRPTAIRCVRCEARISERFEQDFTRVFGTSFDSFGAETSDASPSSSEP
jgi:hypothetical protein